MEVEAYDPNALVLWSDRLTKWCASGRADLACLGPFASLAKKERIICFNGAPRRHGFAEALVASRLENEGYRCWTGVQLFPWDGRAVRAADRRRNTEEVEGLLRDAHIPLPRTFLARLDEQRERHGRMKNPDLVCYHAGRGAWRFIEVKRNERVLPGQVNALAFLHVLTGAEVAIIRLWPESRPAPAKRSYLGKVVVSAVASAP